MAIYWKKGPFLDAFLHSSRLDLPGLNKGRPSLFSLCSWKENGEHKRWNFCFLMEMLKAFYILHWNKNEAFWNVAWESREKATQADYGRGESKGLLGSSPERVSFESRECPRTNVRERRTAIVRSHTGQGRKPTVWCLQCSPGSQETWLLALRSQVSAQMGDGGVSLCFRPAVPQQARNFLKKGSSKPKKHIPCRLEKCCRTACVILRTVSRTISIILICKCFTQYKSQNPNPGTPGLRFLISISTVVPPAEEQKVDILTSAFWSDHTTWQAEADLYFTLQQKSETSH